MHQSPALPLVDAVVPAAGRSRRAGLFKPAAVVRGRPLLVHAVEALRPFCRRVVVVTGWRQDEAAALVAGLPGVVAVAHPGFDAGMFSSVQAGVGALQDGAAGFLVLPADCPFVGPEVIAALLEAFAAAGGGRAVVPEHDGRGGHPVLLPDAARRLVTGAAPEATLRTVVAACAPLRLPVSSPAVLADLDTPGDLADAEDETRPLP